MGRDHRRTEERSVRSDIGFQSHVIDPPHRREQPKVLLGAIASSSSSNPRSRRRQVGEVACDVLTWCESSSIIMSEGVGAPHNLSAQTRHAGSAGAASHRVHTTPCRWAGSGRCGGTAVRTCRTSSRRTCWVHTRLRLRAGKNRQDGSSNHTLHHNFLLRAAGAGPSAGPPVS